jgi:putative transposase
VFVTDLPTQLGAAAKTASERGYNQVRIFAQDESRIGLLPIVRHRITARGVQPTISSAYRFESFYLYGAVEPATGESFFLELPHLNTDTFQIFVNELAKAFTASCNILLLDNGAFHKAKALALADNLITIFLPPYSPELNPIERLWRDLKDQLAGNLPHTLDELFEQVAQIITRYSTNDLRSLTAFSYLIEAITSANVYQS